MSSTEYDYLYKVAISGDAGVGKSVLFSRFVHDNFNPEYISTIGVEFGTRTIDIDGKIVKAQIWDTAGQERFRAITTSYYRGSMGAILVYDITKRQTFDNMKNWLEEARKHSSGDTVIMLVGTKCDLADLRQVTTEEAREFADEENILFMEVSAKGPVNVEATFRKMFSEIANKLSNVGNAAPLAVGMDAKPVKKKSVKSKSKVDEAAFKDAPSWAMELISQMNEVNSNVNVMNAKLEKLELLEEKLDDFENNMRDAAEKMTSYMKK